jgi:hypothetical protein
MADANKARADLLMTALLDSEMISAAKPTAVGRTLIFQDQARDGFFRSRILPHRVIVVCRQRGLITLERRPTIMDTMTYASLAAIPWTVAESNERPIVPEIELTPLDLAALGSISR